ncbi:SafA/ExsA family spore coat assembly protein [Halalkalibacterium halodurans]|uniref:SafA/ExsA family spore coat assembly protein n=1 Tax=Halalkalibacterium halodurans TaxID=86665 RepID=UPI001ABB05F9|nr:SafA/ExsA family spore coat assembly protein [Halalkalibacterium halodurans]
MKIHIVQKGDTLWKLAKKYGVDFEQLKAANSQLANPDMIMPGMKIKIPTGSVPVKKEGPHVQVKEQPVQPIHPKEAPTPPPTHVMPQMPTMPHPKVTQEAKVTEKTQNMYETHLNFNYYGQPKPPVAPIPKPPKKEMPKKEIPKKEVPKKEMPKKEMPKQKVTPKEFPKKEMPKKEMPKPTPPPPKPKPMPMVTAPVHKPMPKPKPMPVQMPMHMPVSKCVQPQWQPVSPLMPGCSPGPVHGMHSPHGMYPTMPQMDFGHHEWTPDMMPPSTWGHPMQQQWPQMDQNVHPQQWPQMDQNVHPQQWPQMDQNVHPQQWPQMDQNVHPQQWPQMDQNVHPQQWPQMSQQPMQPQMMPFGTQPQQMHGMGHSPYGMMPGSGQGWGAPSQFSDYEVPNQYREEDDYED